MRASVRSRLPRAYLYARHDRRWIRLRLKPWWRHHRCRCCEPWVIDRDHFRPLVTRRVFGLRLYALEWLRLLAPLAPRLRGPLAQDSDEPDCFVTDIEIDVAGDGLRPLLDLLRREGYRSERLGSGASVVLSVDALVPIEIRLRRGEDDASPQDPACAASELERLVHESHHPGYPSFLDWR